MQHCALGLVCPRTAPAELRPAGRRKAGAELLDGWANAGVECPVPAWAVNKPHCAVKTARSLQYYHIQLLGLLSSACKGLHWLQNQARTQLALALLGISHLMVSQAR